MMRVAIHDFGGFAFSAELARALASRHHEVLYLRSEGFRPSKPQCAGANAGTPTLTMETVSIGRQARDGITPGRLRDERAYGIELGERIAIFKPDVLLSANSPLHAQAHAQAGAHRTGAAS